MVTEFKPGAKVRIEKTGDELANTETKSGPTWITFAVGAIIAGLVVGSLYFSTVGRNAPALADPPRGSTGQSAQPPPAISGSTK